jgi:hypothetical protein
MQSGYFNLGVTCTAAFACVAALTTQRAVAQGAAWELRLSNPVSPQTPTATVEVWARFDPADPAGKIIGGLDGWSL